ncbi:MAG: protein kinase [Vicinamibacterales bacterium]
MIGRTLGPYNIVERIGEGGMGTVYRAEDVMLGRDVAIKVLRADLAHDATLIERFRQEARNLALVVHPNVAALYGLFQEQGVLFMAMEYARGETADAMLRRRGALPWAEAAGLMTGVLAGLDAAHRRGIIHRDLKPANLIVGGGGVKITDFGIARMLGAARHTRTGAIVGTLAYMAPEQIRGEEGDGRTDIYAAGMVLYELLTGAVAFRHTSEYDLMRAVVEEPARAPRASDAEVPGWLDAIVVRTLEKNPAARFQTADQMLAALNAGLDDAGASAVMATRVAEAHVAATRMAIAPAPETVIAVAPAARFAIPAAWTWKHLAAGAAIVVVLTTLGFAAMGRDDGARRDEQTQPAAVQPPPASSTVPPAVSSGFEPPREPIAPPAQPPVADRPIRRPVVTPAPAPARPAPVETAPPVVELPPAEPPAPVAAPAPAVPPDAPPRRASLDAVTFDRVKLLQNIGGKVREVDAQLTFDGDRLRVTAEKDGLVLKTLAYRAVTDATFSQSKHPRWKEGGAAAVAVGVFAAPLFFMKGTKHWLTVEAGPDFIVLRLDKNNFRMVLPAFEARWGKTIERRAEDR